jgi:hypothetical protein
VSNLLGEIGLRLLKALSAAVVGLIIYLFCVSTLGATPSVELGLLSWLSGAAFVLLVESGIF